MDELRERYIELHNLPAPTGLVAVVDELDVAIYQYTDEIMGLVSAYLTGQEVNLSDIHIDESLDQKLEECITKIDEFRSYKQKHDKLARLLMSRLSKGS